VFGVSQSETFAWEYWKAMGAMRPWDAAALYVQTVEMHNPNWWSLLLANDMERGRSVRTNENEGVAPLYIVCYSRALNLSCVYTPSRPLYTPQL
jgi:hypothetical protein